MTTTAGIVPHPMTKEEGNARLDVIRAKVSAAHLERVRAQQRIESTFHDRRD